MLSNVIEWLSLSGESLCLRPRISPGLVATVVLVRLKMLLREGRACLLSEGTDAVIVDRRFNLVLIRAWKVGSLGKNVCNWGD